MDKKPIEVRFTSTECLEVAEPSAYFKYIERRLKEAGIPVEGDKVLEGILTRLDDPNDFGVFIYRWEPDNELLREPSPCPNSKPAN